jgi:hypothetical protein
MAYSNSTSNIGNCQLPSSFWTSVNNAHFAFYTIIQPCCAIFGIFGHIIFILAIRSGTTKQKAYRYQSYSLVSETLEIIMFVLNTISRRLSGIYYDDMIGWLWYRKIYILMFYSAHVSIPLLDSTLSISLFLAVCASADRVFVLTKPVAYQNLNHKLYQNLALVICVSVGLLINADNCFLIELDYDNGTKMYSIVLSDLYVHNRAIVIWGFVGHAIRILAIILLITCNFVIVRQYRKRFGNLNDNKEAKKRKAEKTLILLIVCESSFFTIGTFVFIGNFISHAIAPDLYLCEGAIFAPLMNSVLMLASAADFYAALVISKHFRLMVKNTMARLFRKHRQLNGNQVGATGTGN